MLSKVQKNAKVRSIEKAVESIPAARRGGTGKLSPLNKRRSPPSGDAPTTDLTHCTHEIGRQRQYTFYDEILIIFKIDYKL